MMHVDRILPGIATGATFVGGAIVVLAQSILDPTAENLDRLFSISGLLVAAFLVVRWTRSLMKDVQQLRAEENNAALNREEKLLEELAQARRDYADLNAELRQERQLRLSLEQMGLRDRRIVEPNEKRHSEPPDG